MHSAGWGKFREALSYSVQLLVISEIDALIIELHID